MSENNKRIILEMKGIDKSFFGVQVLHDVSFEIRKGEVMALLGENGAGKSTLMKILNGIYTKDKGDVFIEGKRVNITGPDAARKNGISIVHQELNYFPSLSVAENIRLGMGARGKRRINWKETNRKAKDILKRFNVEIKPTTEMGSLSVGICQIITILEAVSEEGSKVVVMDEPTSALNANEVVVLFEIIEELKNQGISIIYISHRLEEIMKIADRYTILRDGFLVGVGDLFNVNKGKLVELMTGRQNVQLETEALEREDLKVALEVKNLSCDRYYENVNMKLFEGEVLCISGLVGCGNKELIKTLYGCYPFYEGEILMDQTPVKLRTINDARKNRIGFVPEDRKNEGAIGIMTVKDNITLANWKEISKGGFFQPKKEVQDVKKWVDELSIKIPGGIGMQLRELSGGNQQKVVMARWMEAHCRILLLDEPSLGVDVGARHDIHSILRALAKEGLSVIMVSSDIDEVIEVADRTIVMYRGRVVGEAARENATKELLLEMSLGGKVDYE